MYLKNFKADQTADRATIRCTWNDRFHKPAYVNITGPAATHVSGAEDVMMLGDVKDVHGILFGCAQIAWSLGWRPKGLMPALMNLMTSFKPPPPDGQGR